MKELDTEDMPFPLLRAYIRFDEEIQDFKKLHRLLDAIEVLVKVHTVIIVSDYFSRTEPSEKLKGLLAAGLKSLPWGFGGSSPVIFAWKKCRMERIFFASGIEKFVGAKNKGYDQWKGALNEAMQAEDNLISFRNKYAHGATPPDDECRADFTKFEKVFRELILGALHFREVCIVGIGDDGKSLFPKISAVYQEAAKKVPKGREMVGRCYALRQDGQYLDLHPCFFSDHKKKIGVNQAFSFTMIFGKKKRICWNMMLVVAGETKVCEKISWVHIQLIAGKSIPILKFRQLLIV